MRTTTTKQSAVPHKNAMQCYSALLQSQRVELCNSDGKSDGKETKKVLDPYRYRTYELASSSCLPIVIRES